MRSSPLAGRATSLSQADLAPAFRHDEALQSRRKLDAQSQFCSPPRAEPPDQAPASGRLAAAIATKRAMCRLIRMGVERSNERTRSIDISSRAGKSMAHKAKWWFAKLASRLPEK
jgi:hypothetical protein